MSMSKIVSPLKRKEWHILFLFLSIAVIVLFSIHTIIMELARQAALGVDALMYTQNLMNSGLSVEIGTGLLVTWLVMTIIFFAVHPGHKSSPFDWLLAQGFIFGILLTTLWSERSLLLVNFDYAVTPPDTLIHFVTAVLPVYEVTSGGLVLLVLIYTLLTWFKVIMYAPES
ncbi:MAG: hypothetical protein ACFFCF_11670 [Promethearchaeota archaeon]